MGAIVNNWMVFSKEIIPTNQYNIEHHPQKAGDTCMKVGFIGAGKVGCSLYDYFVHNNIPVTGCYTRTQAKVSGTEKQTQKIFTTSIDKILTKSDVLFLTVPDDAISTVWEQVRTYPIQGKFICHCSGSLGSAVLSGIEETGAYGYSIHPMFPFKSKKTAYEDLAKALFSVEGNEEHIEEIMDLLSACPNHIVRLKSGDKPKYHAAAVFASNLAVGLINQAKELLKECGFDDEAALMALKPLAVTNMNNIFEVGTCDALTGPVERHDIKTIQKHLNAIDQEKKETYSALTKEIIKLAQTRHPDISYADMKHVLEEEK